MNETLNKLGLISMNTQVGAFSAVPMSTELSPTKLNRLQQSVEKNVSQIMRNADPRASISVKIPRGASLDLMRKTSKHPSMLKPSQIGKKSSV